MTKIKNILKSIKRTHYVYFILLGLIYSLVYIFQLLSPLYQKSLLDIVIEESRMSVHFLSLFIGTQVGIPLVSIICNLLYSRLKLKIDKHFFFYYLNLLVNQRKSRIREWGSGQCADMMFADISNFTASIFNLALFDLIFSIIQAVVVFFIVIKWSALYGIICASYFMIALLISLLFSSSQITAYSKNRKATGEMYNELIDQLSNTRIIRQLSIGHMLQLKLKISYENMQNGLLRILNLQSLPYALLELLRGAGLIIMLTVSINLLLTNSITYGTLLAMFSYYLIIINPVNNIVETMQRIRYAGVSIKRLNNIENHYLEDCCSNPELIPLETWQEITISGLNFAYDDAHKIFNELTFEINDGITGLVGLSGEGKSSLISSLLRELSLKEGSISVGKQNINLFPLRYYIFKINHLPQIVEIFDQDLEYNLTLNRQKVTLAESEFKIAEYKSRFELLFTEVAERFDPSKLSGVIKWLESENDLLPCLDLIGIYRKEYNDIEAYKRFVEFISLNIEEIAYEAAKICFEQNYVIEEKIKEVISKTGIENLKGRKLGTGGATISGGEKQRLALARFLLRENTELAILDEPFTSLDLITERELIYILKQHLKGRKGILITHNIKVLLNLADTYHIMENGKITQSGKHSDLINQEGLYHDLLKCFNENADPSKEGN